MRGDHPLRAGQLWPRSRRGSSMTRDKRQQVVACTPPYPDGFRRTFSICKVRTLAPILAIVIVPALMAAQDVRLTPVEQFVVGELKAGREADLSNMSPKDRILTHE